MKLFRAMVVVAALVAAVAGCAADRGSDIASSTSEVADGAAGFAELESAASVQPAIALFEREYTSRGMSLNPGSSGFEQRWWNPPPCSPLDWREWLDLWHPGGWAGWYTPDTPNHITTAWFEDLFPHSELLSHWACQGPGGRLVGDVRLMLPGDRRLGSLFKSWNSAGGGAGGGSSNGEGCPEDPTSVYPLPANCSIAEVACSSSGFWKACSATCAKVRELCGAEPADPCGGSDCDDGEETPAEPCFCSAEMKAAIAEVDAATRGGFGPSQARTRALARLRAACEK